jgi:hypothetical protein
MAARFGGDALCFLGVLCASVVRSSLLAISNVTEVDLFWIIIRM